MSPIAQNEAVAQAPVSCTEDAPKLIREPVRLAFHVGGISFCGASALLMDPLMASYFLVAFIPFFSLYELLRSSQRVNRWPAWTILGPLARLANRFGVREHEKGTRTATLDLLVALAIVWMTCSPTVVSIACFITAFGDPLARIVGKNWGKYNWPGSKKTIEGSFAFWSVAVLVCVTFSLAANRFTPVAFLVAIVVATVATLLELIPQYPDQPKPGTIISPADNFWLILGSAYTLCLTQSLFA